MFGGAAAAVMAASFPIVAEAQGARTYRALNLHNLNNGERINEAFMVNGRYSGQGVANLTRFMRDWRNNQVHNIDMDVFEILFAIQTQLGLEEGGLQLISGFRSAQTNEMLRRRSGGVAQRSLHLVGRAADVRAPSAGLGRLHKTALGLRAGGVGYYSRSNFVHVDNGRVRTW